MTTKDELITKYADKCNKAKLKKDEMRREYHSKKDSDPGEAHWDELERESYAREFYLSEEILNDLKQLDSR